MALVWCTVSGKNVGTKAARGTYFLVAFEVYRQRIFLLACKVEKLESVMKERDFEYST